MACGGGVRTSAGGVVVGEMMRLVHWYSFTDALVADVLQPEHTRRRLWQRVYLSRTSCQIAVRTSSNLGTVPISRWRAIDSRNPNPHGFTNRVNQRHIVNFFRHSSVIKTMQEEHLGTLQRPPRCLGGGI